MAGERVKPIHVQRKKMNVETEAMPKKKKSWNVNLYFENDDYLIVYLNSIIKIIIFGWRWRWAGCALGTQHHARVLTKENGKFCVINWNDEYFVEYTFRAFSVRVLKDFCEVWLRHNDVNALRLMNIFCESMAVGGLLDVRKWVNGSKQFVYQVFYAILVTNFNEIKGLGVVSGIDDDAVYSQRKYVTYSSWTSFYFC